MVIEILFQEVCGLYGDSQNPVYLQKTLPDAEFIFTALTDTPYFVDHSPDMIYIGCMSESTQRRVISKLLPFKDRIQNLVEQGVVFLATGNAGEIFTKQIDYVADIFEATGSEHCIKVVDPAMADNGKLYPGFDHAFVEAMKILCATADYLIPNLTEACLLTDTEYRTDNQLSECAVYKTAEEFRQNAHGLFDKNLLYTPWNKLYRAEYIMENNIRYSRRIMQWYRHCKSNIPFNC